MTIKFYNRERELSVLESVKKPFFAVIYGRRRIGKTSLSLKFAENKDHVYFFVNPKKSENLLLEEFSEILRRKLNLKEYVRPGNWEEFFSLLFRYRGIVIFDEFQWFLEVNKSVPFILQKYWDTEKNKPSFILTGSTVGMVKKLFEREGSPLFKRSDVVIRLGELEPGDVFNILEDLKIKSFEKKFEFFLIFGGVPYYYRFVEKYGVRDIETCLKKLVFDELGPLRNEVEEVMVEAFKREYRTYLSILLAIAEGKTKMEEISSYAGIKHTSLPYYLSDLTDRLGIVEKHRISFKKKFVYHIKDRFYNFWLRYVYKNSSTENSELLFEKVMKDVNSFFGWSFETTVRENILKIFTDLERKMKYYGSFREGGERKVFDIDVVALNEKTREILFAECKWQPRVNAEKVCRELARKTEYVDWHKNGRKESFAVFARSFSKRISEFEGRPVHCFDLKDLKRVLSRGKRDTSVKFINRGG